MENQKSGKNRYLLDRAWQALFDNLNISAQDVLRHAGLPLDLLARKMPTVTAAGYFRLWDSFAYLLKDVPAFPLQITRAMTVETFNPLIFACLCSTDLSMALRRLIKYKPTIAPLHLDIQQSERQTVFSVAGISDNYPVPDSLMAFELVFWVHIARYATRDHIIPEAVHVTMKLPDIEIYETFFGIQLTQDRFNGLTFSARDMHKPFLTANDSMWSIFEPELRKRLQDLKQGASFRDRVRACLLEILAGGRYSKADVASKLAISSRTLQRRLREENTSFQKVLNELREELAHHYLSNPEYTNGEIAFLLGYEEPNSFFRAFRTWTGKTPEHVRTSVQ